MSDLSKSGIRCFRIKMMERFYKRLLPLKTDRVFSSVRRAKLDDEGDWVKHTWLQRNKKIVIEEVHNVTRELTYRKKLGTIKDVSLDVLSFDILDEPDKHDIIVCYGSGEDVKRGFFYIVDFTLDEVFE